MNFSCFPVIANIYGGPNATRVVDGYHSTYTEKKEDTNDIISIQMDHRGSGHFGKVGQMNSRLLAMDTAPILLIKVEG